ncbi:MAG TPA: hypothetical protein VIK91_28680 [Nannocystis sp.]
MTLRSLLVLSTLYALALMPRGAQAAPVSVGGQVSTEGASATASGPTRAGFELPQNIIAGNALTALMPVQVGFAGYLPRVRIGIQYERQLYKAHWVYLQVASLLDRGDWHTFRLPTCGLDMSLGSCNRGTVAGFDLTVGYAHKWYLKEHPYLVPIARVGVNGGAWWYPYITESRQQSRERSWSMSVRGGGGVRLFLLRNLAIGLDLNLVLGFIISRDRPLSQPSETNANFLIGMEILPLLVEYRF